MSVNPSSKVARILISRGLDLYSAGNLPQGFNRQMVDAPSMFLPNSRPALPNNCDSPSIQTKVCELTRGFIARNQKRTLLGKRYAVTRGLVVVTDSSAAIVRAMRHFSGLDN
jgi:hypothetical protein